MLGKSVMVELDICVAGYTITSRDGNWMALSCLGSRTRTQPSHIYSALQLRPLNLVEFVRCFSEEGLVFVSLICLWWGAQGEGREARCIEWGVWGARQVQGIKTKKYDAQSEVLLEVQRMKAKNCTQRMLDDKKYELKILEDALLSIHTRQLKWE